MAEGYLLYVNWRNEHNHGLAGADALRKRDVSAITIERLTELFERGHSPSSALETIKYDLQEEEGDEYVYAAADRAICPDLQFCYRLAHHIGETTKNLLGYVLTFFLCMYCNPHCVSDLCVTTGYTTKYSRNHTVPLLEKRWL